MELLPELVTAVAASNVWSALIRGVENNPTLTLLGFIIAAFGAGMATSRFFRDFKKQALEARVKQLEQELSVANKQLSEFNQRESDARKKLDQISDCLNPRELKLRLSKELSHWSSDKHDVIIVGLIRQFLNTPAHAWLCTPTGSTSIEVEFDSERGACKISSKTSDDADPVRELRQIISNPESLRDVLLDLATFGITSVALNEGPSRTRRIVVRQGPGSDWQTVQETLQRVPADAP